MNDTNNQPDRLTPEAVRARLQAAGPAGESVADLLSWARSTFPGDHITRNKLALILDGGVDAGWYVEYEAGTFRDGEAVQTHTFVATEHARPSAAELHDFIGQARSVGQRRQDLFDWLQTRYHNNEHVRLDHLDWWLGELSGARKVVPTDRNGTTYFVAVEHSDLDRPQELSRLRLPVQLSEYSRWLNAVDQVHADQLNGRKRGVTQATTDHVRVEQVNKVSFAVFYDRPVA